MMPHFFLAFLLIFTTAHANKKLVLKLVAKVDQKLMSSRDVEAHYIVERLSQGMPTQLPLSVNSDEFKIATDQLVIETMVFEEAKNFSIAKVTPEEIDKSFKTIKEKIVTTKNVKARWDTLNYNDSQLRDFVERHLRVEKLIKYKTDASFSQVSDEEAQEYYNKNRLRFGTMSFESFKPNIKKFMAKRNSEERLRDWFDVLKRKYKVRNLI